MPGSVLTLLGLVAVATALAVLGARDHRNRVATAYGQDQRVFRSNWAKLGLFLGALLYVSIPAGTSWIGHGGAHLPANLIPGAPASSFWLTVLCYAGIYALGAIGLNLLIGFTGQVSIGHAFFMGIGAYSIGYFGKDWTPFGDKPLPPIVWLAIAGVLGAAISAAIGPFALRLRGHYLAIVSIGLVIFGEHLFSTAKFVTKGSAGRTDLPPFHLTIWPGKTIFFSITEAPNGDGDVFGYTWSKAALYFWLIWGIVIVGVVLARNLVRSRQGRAMMAIRDRDLSAEVIGVEQAYTKVWAFAIAGAYASIAGALYGSFYNYAKPETFGGPGGLALSIAFVAMIIVGGVGSILGSVLGGIAIAMLDYVIERSTWLIDWLPFIQTDPAARGLTVPRSVKVIEGLVIIAFLMFFPLGLNGLWQRTRRYFQTWPFTT